MFQRLRFVVLLLVAAVAARSPGVTEMPPAVRWVPPEAVICVQVTQPEALLGPLTSERTAAIVKALPAYQKTQSSPKFQEVMMLVRFLETALDADWRTALPRLVGGGITFAVCPNDTVLLIVDAKDEDLLRRTHELFVTMARSDAQEKGRPDRVASAKYRGVTHWTFDGEEAHALIGRRLVFSNKLDGLKAALQLRDNPPMPSAATDPGYAAAREAIGSDVAAMAYANLAVLKNIPDLAQAFSQDKSNPLAALFFSGIGESVRSATWMAVGLRTQEDGVTLDARLDGAAAGTTGAATFAQPVKPGQGAGPYLTAPRQIAALSFYRDLYRFYAAKDDLFPERTSELIFFENMMGIFFSGRNLTDEVLAETQPDVRFVVAQQQYDLAIGTPQTQIPAFAVVLRLRDPEAFDEVVEEAYQKALGLINFTRGQQAMPGLIIDRPVHNGTKFTTAYFSTADLEDNDSLPTRFNFRPSLALPGDYLILSSTEALARDLIDAAANEATGRPEPLAGIHSAAAVNGVQLASILQANYDTLVRQNMVKEGSTQEAAESQIDVLISLARLVKRVELTVGSSDRMTRGRLGLKLNLN
jgi:hypothetical protein